MNDRAMPCDLGAEEMVIASVFLGGIDTLAEVREVLTVESFYNTLNRKVYKSLCSLGDNGMDVFDLPSVMTEMGSTENISLIATLSGQAGTAKNAKRHANIVAMMHKRRRIIHRMNNLTEELYKHGGDESIRQKEIGQTIELMEKDLHLEDYSAFNHIESVIDQYLDNVEYAYENPNLASGISSSLHGLDDIIGGLKGAVNYLIAARPSMGKSGLGLQIIDSASIAGKSAGVVSLEMGSESLVNRIVSSDTGIDSFSIENGRITKDQLGVVRESAERIKKRNIWIASADVRSPKQVDAACRGLLRNHPIDILMVDYLQLMEGDGRGDMNEERELSLISKGLVSIAKTFKIPVLALSQLNRRVESRPDKRPTLSDIRGSGSIEQDSDVVMFMYRPEYYGISEIMGEDVEELCEILVAKQRNGPIGVARSRFRKATSKFEDWGKTSSSAITGSTSNEFEIF
jgi:replicative DNA helicase